MPCPLGTHLSQKPRPKGGTYARGVELTEAERSTLLRALFELCPHAAPQPEADELPEFLDYQPRARSGPRFRILRTDRGYRVVGTPPPADELEEALRALGIKHGTQVEVGDEELEWQ